MKIWSNFPFNDLSAWALEQAVVPHSIEWSKVQPVSSLHVAPSDGELVNECEVAYGQPNPDDVIHSQKLRWVALSSAGYTRYDTEEFRAACAAKKISVTNSSSVYNEPCAQHALAMMLAANRQLSEALRSQFGARDFPFLQLRRASRLLSRETLVLLVGYGAIARRLVELLAPFGCQVVAFRREPRGDENCRTLATTELRTFIGRADHVVNILPATRATQKFFNADVLAQIKRGAAFYNIGRGDTVDQLALLAALRSGQMGTAYLDVTDPEPLPPEHPLWAEPHCFITPHMAGGSNDEMARQLAHFTANLARFNRSESLQDRVF